jgi:hypothetical protein
MLRTVSQSREEEEGGIEGEGVSRRSSSSKNRPRHQLNFDRFD